MMPDPTTFNDDGGQVIPFLACRDCPDREFDTAADLLLAARWSSLNMAERIFSRRPTRENWWGFVKAYCCWRAAFLSMEPALDDDRDDHDGGGGDSLEGAP